MLLRSTDLCLLNEAGKLLEQVVATRLVEHLSRVVLGCTAINMDSGGTIDAILAVRSFSESVIRESGVLLAVSLDIVNAFNILSWEAMQYHGFPPYREGLLLRQGPGIQGLKWMGYPLRDLTGIHLDSILWYLANDRVIRTVPCPSTVGSCVTTY